MQPFAHDEEEEYEEHEDDVSKSNAFFDILLNVECKYK